MSLQYPSSESCAVGLGGDEDAPENPIKLGRSWAERETHGDDLS